MSETVEFSGFPEATPRFFEALARHNDRAWFEAHREDFERDVLDPARGFVVTLGARLGALSRNLVADPRVDKSIFRLHRDTRFSKDKSPFKTHLGLLWWEDTAKKMESPGYYFHLEPGRLMLCAGMWIFTPAQLRAYRRAVVDPKAGRALLAAVKKTEDAGCGVGGEHYKRVPPGLRADGRRARLLLHNGLYGIWEGPLPAEFHRPAIVEWSLERFRALAPIERWLVRHL